MLDSLALRCDMSLQDVIEDNTLKVGKSRKRRRHESRDARDHAVEPPVVSAFPGVAPSASSTDALDITADFMPPTKHWKRIGAAIPGVDPTKLRAGLLALAQSLPLLLSCNNCPQQAEMFDDTALPIGADEAEQQAQCVFDKCPRSFVSRRPLTEVALPIAAPVRLKYCSVLYIIAAVPRYFVICMRWLSYLSRHIGVRRCSHSNSRKCLTSAIFSNAGTCRHHASRTAYISA